MQTTMCSNCGQSLPAGAAFCASCGAPQQPANKLPASASEAETVRAGAPPAGAEYAPTQLQPPPAPAAPSQASSSGPDAYASQYTPSPPAPPPYPYAGPSGPSGVYPSAPGPQGPVMPPPPMYAPGPPPPVAPGGVVQPWAQAPKKRSGAKTALGCLLALVLVVAVLGGGGFLLVKALASRGGNTTHQGSGPSSTPGAGSTPGSGSTPGGGGGSGTQTLDNLNRQAIYAGVTITLVSAQEAASLPDRQEADPNLYALEVQVKESNQTTHTVSGTFTAIDPNGNTYQLYIFVPSSFEFWSANSVGSGALVFDVPRGSKIGDFTIQVGTSAEALVTIPLSGNYDPTQWQQVTHQIGQTVTYDDGKIKGTVTQVVVGLWTPGYQAPKDQRFLMMYLHVVNSTSFAITVGDGVPPQYLLLFPNGDRAQASTIYGTPIDVVVAGGESKDVGYDVFLIPTAPAPYTMVFLNPDGSKAGQVNLGTL